MPEPDVRADERDKTITLIEQTLFDLCTGVKVGASPERANAGFVQFVKLSDAFRKALGDEWPNR